MAWQGSSWGLKRVLCTCSHRGGDGKMEAFFLPGFGVLLAGIALYNVYECVPAVKTRPGPYGSLCSEACAFYINMLLSLLSLCSYFTIMKIIKIIKWWKMMKSNLRLTLVRTGTYEYLRFCLILSNCIGFQPEMIGGLGLMNFCYHDSPGLFTV